MANYLSITEQECKEMLETIGVKKCADLYADIPLALKNRTFNLASGKSHQEVLDELTQYANENTVYNTIMRGAGAYDHFIPSVVKYLSSRSEFLTAYTPYQAEMSQGILQSIFEFQTMICSLTGMEVANASVYDGSSAAAEAAFMCVEKERRVVLVSENVKPQVIEVLKTYLSRRDITIKVLTEKDGYIKDGKLDNQKLMSAIDEHTACVYFEQPNYYGVIEDAEYICNVVREKGAKSIIGCNPMTLALLKSPGECGADIAVGDAQPFGLSISFGGPYLGFMATHVNKDTMRRMPGRIVGQTTDDKGNRAFVLTLQGREQHIRREKALSNICSNQAHCALVASMYLSAMGKEGLKEVASACTSLAHYAAEQFTKGSCTLKYGSEFFHEFVTVTPVKAEKIVDKCAKLGILAGLPIGSNEILWCMTEKVRKEDIDKVAEIMGRV
ncbi:MAG: aminomethyl-transferring glycine dehydrogenase subunit GcvPA [Clostridiales bacterium]|nr:aminomethyl-transferring glycine dehydrogenase subunit GcvPA [Clostridiales bacterium]